MSTIFALDPPSNLPTQGPTPFFITVLANGPPVAGYVAGSPNS
jgi:hypothetical protein